MNISIIIPTYNGAKKIVKLLVALEKQSYKDFDTIVVIDGSTDDTSKILKNRSFDLNSLYIIEQKNKGRAYTRNAGAKKAKDGLLIFFDDDMRPNENVIEKHIDHHKNHQKTILTGTQQSDPEFINNDFLKFKFWAESKWFKRFENSSDKIRINMENYFFTSAHFSINKALFSELGMFDEKLTDSEDFDLSMKAIKKNIKIFYDANILAWHDEIININEYINRQNEYIKSKLKLLEMHPDYIQMHPQSFNFNKPILKRFYLFFFKLNSFWSYILKSKLFVKLLPQLIRFKIYDLIIYASIK